MMDKNTAIDKIIKLRALAACSAASKSERATAKRRADFLAQQHSLQQSDIDKISDGVKISQAMYETDRQKEYEEYYAVFTEEMLREEIEGFRNLPDNFDSSSRKVAAKIDIENALSFVQHIPPRGMDGARVMIGIDNEVAFNWVPLIFFGVEFLGGKISYYGKTADGKSIDSRLPKNGGPSIYNGDPPAELMYLFSVAKFPPQKVGELSTYCRKPQKSYIAAKSDRKLPLKLAIHIFCKRIIAGLAKLWQ